MTVAVQFAVDGVAVGAGEAGGVGVAAEQPLFGQLDPRRRHRLTASMLGDAVGLSKYVTPKLLWQLWTGRVKDEREVGSEFTEHGDATEPVAREVYERMFRGRVEPSGFVIHRDKDWLGATPDGLVGDSGLLEIKAPFYQLYKDIPPHYMAQMQGQLECCDRSFCDFFVLCTRTQEVCVYSVSRSREYWAWIEPLLVEFFACVHADVEPTRLTWPPSSPPPAVPTRCLYRGPVLDEWKTPGFLQRIAWQQEEIAARERAMVQVRAERDVLLVVRNLVDRVCSPIELAAERAAREAARAQAAAQADAEMWAPAEAHVDRGGGAGAGVVAEQGGGGVHVEGVMLMELDANPREGESGLEVASGARADEVRPLSEMGAVAVDLDEVVCIEEDGDSGVTAAVAGARLPVDCLEGGSHPAKARGAADSSGCTAL